MDKLEANKIIHEKIMGECVHRFHDDGVLSIGSSKCLDCGTYYKMAFGVPDYCNDSNAAVKALYKLELTDFYFQAAFWNAEYRDEDNGIQLVSNTDINLAICTAALRTVGITEEIE